MQIDKIIDQSSYSQKDFPIIVQLIQQTHLIQMTQSLDIQDRFIKIFDRMFQSLKHDTLLQTKWLGLFSSKFTLSEFTQFDGIFLHQCIQSQNYKLGYQHVKGAQWCETQLNKIYNLDVYFLCAGIIMQAMQDYDEALRYYSLAIKLSNKFIILKEETIKLKTLLMFRMGISKSLSETSRDNSHLLDEYLSQLLTKPNSSEQLPQQSFKQLQQDKDIKLCYSECENAAPILYELQKKKKIYHRISFKQICQECNVTQENLIPLLLEVNEMCDILLINEEKQYIQFKRNHSLQEINEKLDARMDLVKNLLSIR